MIDRKSEIPLYIQIRDNVRNKIISGEYPAGSIFPNEIILSNQLGVSRHTLRRALLELTDEGYMNRTQRKGTFIRDLNDTNISISTQKHIGLIMTAIDTSFVNGILSGFLDVATSHSYSTIFDVSKDDFKYEIDAINRMVKSNVKSITVFPAKVTHINGEFIKQLRNKGVNISFIDRSTRNMEVDYVGSDNQSGGYMAARHIAMQSFKNVLYVGNNICISSVSERFMGFYHGVKRYKLSLINGNDKLYKDSDAINFVCSTNEFKTNLELYRKYLPFAIFCENDAIAIELMSELKAVGLIVGKDVGIIGFDNITSSKYISPGLTTISQNALLIGQTAAKMAIEKIESKGTTTIRHILPTQLLIRKSCGEDHAK